jgi:hypothetical protein
MYASCMTPTEKTQRKTANYLVLEFVLETGCWRELGHYEAATARDAVKQATSDEEAEDMLYVAVPARSWKPIRRQVQQVTKASWS